jgi:uncharacterized membrane protein
MRALRRASTADNVARSRIEAFSDGVFAIVVTLLVFEIRPPALEDGESAWELAYRLWEMAPSFVSWVISFVTVCVIWLNHCRLLDLVEEIDDRLFWLNANMLLWTSFLPFPTALMGDYPTNRLAVTVYGVSMLFVGIAFMLIRLRLHRRPELLRDDVDAAMFRTGTVYSVALGPAAYVVGIALGFVHEAFAFACYAGVALYWVFPHATRARR